MTDGADCSEIYPKYLDYQTILRFFKILISLETTEYSRTKLIVNLVINLLYYYKNLPERNFSTFTNENNLRVMHESKSDCILLIKTLLNTENSD